MLEKATAHAAIAVTDLDRARQFYGETLGLAMKEDRSGGVTYDAGGTWFLVYPSQFAGTAQSTVMTFEVEDIETAIDELTAKGIAFEHYDLPGAKTDERGIADIEGTLAAWFKDPDGNILALGQLV